jgi:hypothetical protein
VGSRAAIGGILRRRPDGKGAEAAARISLQARSAESEGHLSWPGGMRLCSGQRISAINKTINPQPTRAPQFSPSDQRAAKRR